MEQNNGGYVMRKYHVLLLLPILALGFLGQANGEEKAVEVSVDPNQVVVQVHGIV